jgi:hypothetical protein
MVNNTSSILLSGVFVRLLIAFAEGGEGVEPAGHLSSDGKRNLYVEKFLEGRSQLPSSETTSKLDSRPRRG